MVSNVFSQRSGVLESLTGGSVLASGIHSDVCLLVEFELVWLKS